MLPHPGFEIPDAFLQLRDRCPEFQDGRLLSCVRRPLLGDCRPKLNNQCLPGGYHGWHHSTERAPKPTRHPAPTMTP